MRYKWWPRSDLVLEAAVAPPTAPAGWSQSVRGPGGWGQLHLEAVESASVFCFFLSCHLSVKSFGAGTQAPS